MRRSRILAAACLLSVLGAGPASAALERYTFDPVHTQVLFFVSHLGFSNSAGKFLAFDGGFSFDPDSWASSSVDVGIRTASINMDDQKWEKHLRSEDFFNVQKYPVMGFKSTKVEQTGERQALIHGDLTLLGVTRPVTLEATFNKAGVHPKSKQYVAGFSARTVVKRSEFGMNYGVPMLGDDVEVRLEVEGIRQ